MTRSFGAPCGAAAVLAFGILAPSVASAASLQQITDFGNNPSNAQMYLYIPDHVVSHPPVVVGVHWCHGSAAAFYTGTQYAALADRYGFIVIYPSAPSSDGCWDVHSPATLTHGGGSDSAAIVSMAQYVVQKYGADAQRVYVTGHSSGGMMTNVLLGAYPDVFKAGAAFAGVPFSCFAGTSTWSVACATGTVSLSGAQWGDRVRGAFPGYAGPRPRVQLWHGTLDATLNFANFGEEIKEWTNVLGVGATPTSTEMDTPMPTWIRTRYADPCGAVQVEAIQETGQTHNLVIDAAEAVRFFGLDGTDAGVNVGCPAANADAGARDGGDGALDGAADGAADGASNGVTNGDAGADSSAVDDGGIETPARTADAGSKGASGCAVSTRARRGVGGASGLALVAFAFLARRRRNARA